MISRSVKFLLLAVVVAGCGTDKSILEPQAVSQAAVASTSSAAFGRVVTSVTINGSAAPATVTTASNQSLAFVVGGFTTLDQVIPTWLSTSVTYRNSADGSLTTRCDETDVWTSMMTPGSNLTVSFSAAAPGAVGSYVVTVQAHQEDACSPVFPSAPYPSGPDQLTVIVAPSQTPPVLAPIGNQSVDELAVLSFNATATDSDVPAQTLLFSLGNAATGVFPAGATISPSGAFSWTPSEAQGPGTYRVKVIVTDGTFSDDEEIQIAVNEVNAPPVLTLPADIIVQWGVNVPNVAASASDPDLPANTLTFTKVSGPSWVTVDANGTISFGTTDASNVGAHTVRIRVTDNGAPALSDEEELTLTVQNRPTLLTYQGATSGQYSDKSIFSATLADNGVGTLNGTLIANATVDFSVAGVVAGSASTDASGLASGAFAVTQGAGTHSLLASFAGGAGYTSSSATGSFAVSREEGVLSASFLGSTPLGSDLTVTVQVRELLLNGVEPVPNDGALPGDIGKVVAVGATVRGVNTGVEVHATCGAGTGGTASYASTSSFSCTFAAVSLVTDVYMLEVFLPTADPFYHAATFQANLSIFDPQGGSASGGGSFILGGDRVTFAFHTRPQQNSQGPRSQLVVVRHLAEGGVCRITSSDQMSPANVGSNRVTLNGKGEYRCVDPTGAVTALESDVNIWLIAEDNGTPGAGLDRIWISNNAAVATNMLDMPHPVNSNAVLLTAGNVTVRQAEVSAALRRK